MRIGIVNDLSLAQAVLRRLIESAPGHTVAWTAKDGAEAVARAAADLPDAILMDLVMPGLDGYGLVRRLRADPRTLTVPIILVSARAGEEARHRRGRPLGCVRGGGGELQDRPHAGPVRRVDPDQLGELGDPVLGAALDRFPP